MAALRHCRQPNNSIRKGGSPSNEALLLSLPQVLLNIRDSISDLTDAVTPQLSKALIYPSNTLATCRNLSAIRE